MKKRISPCLHGMRCVSFIVYAAKPPNEGPKVPSLGVAQFSKAKPPNEGPKVPSLGVAQPGTNEKQKHKSSVKILTNTLCCAKR